MHRLINFWKQRLQSLPVHRSHDVKVLGDVSYDLDPMVKVKGQIMYFLVNASPHNFFEVTTSNFA